MDFEKAYMHMKKGEKVSRPGWGGYWYINPQTGRLTIHTKDGVEISNVENQNLIDLDLTVSQTLAMDWWVFRKPYETPMERLASALGFEEEEEGEK